MQAILVSGTAEEIAALALAVQERRAADADMLCYLAERKEAMEAVSPKEEGVTMSSLSDDYLLGLQAGEE